VRPDGDAGLFEVVGLARRLRDAREVFAELVRRHGDVVRFRFGPATFFLIVHPDDVEAILETHADRFERVTGERRVSRRIAGDGLFASEGQPHARERSMLEPVMYERVAGAFAEPVGRLAARWSDTLVAGQPVNVWAGMERFCTELIVQILFGTDPAGGTGRALVDALSATVAAMDALPAPSTRITEMLPPVGGRLRRERAVLDALVATVVEERSREPGLDIASMLLEAEDAEGRRFTHTELRDELVTLYRGHTATSTALALTWWQLAREPEVEARVLDEVDALGDGPPSDADLGRLQYTRMVFQESIRLYPPAWVLARKAVAEHPAGGRTIAPGDRVLLSEWVTHRDPRFWEEPLVFRPERFTPESEASRPRYAYYPQGGGEKMCMGKRMVVPMEAPVLLATIAGRWRFRALPGRDPDLAPRATLKPKSGVWLVPEARA
jgi:cytochrome P450